MRRTRAGERRILGLASLIVLIAAPQFAQAPRARQDGTVLFSSSNPPKQRDQTQERQIPTPTAQERNAPTFTAYDLDVHLEPARSHLAVHATITVRNDGQGPLAHLALQLSSTLRWDNIAIRLDGRSVPAEFGQHVLDTDADHTGKATEAVITLPRPLPVGQELTLTIFYSGEIQASGERLERIGAPDEAAMQADWDAIGPELTALRGFGNVLWYPVASEPLFLGDGAKLFQAVGRSRLRQEGARIRLRLSMEYTGDPPDAAYFCGRRQQLTVTPETGGSTTGEAVGVATATWAEMRLGFRSPSLFVVDAAPTTTADGLIAAMTDHPDTVPEYASAANLVKPILTDWLGATPMEPLTILDHPGQAFEDNAFLVLPMRALGAKVLAPPLIHSLTHAYFHSARPWLNEGVAQFMSLLWTEQTQGRETAIRAMEHENDALALAEPDPADTKTPRQGESLIQASDEIYYRAKAADVLWMLRSIAGEDALKRALRACRSDSRIDRDPEEFERVLEGYAQKNLRWFFEDWVYHDRGLPDLTVVNVTPRQLPLPNGKSNGWLVSVDVRNDGEAVAEVPVTVRSGELTTTERLRIAGRSSASIRILFQTVPDEVQVNDGSVPEMRTSKHLVSVQHPAS